LSFQVLSVNQLELSAIGDFTMTQSLQTQMSFEQFLEWKLETSRYELHHGVAIAMQPTGRHEEITGFLALELALEF
jgi:Uma2 family endonuclease